jgi:hypothetical protein
MIPLVRVWLKCTYSKCQQLDLNLELAWLEGCNLEETCKMYA